MSNRNHRVLLFLLFAFVMKDVLGQEKKYNVLFIAVDDLNNYVSLLRDYPGLKTPNLDEFSETAITFEKAYCPAPACNPSRASILTGISPSRSGLYENSDFFRNSEVAMAATLMPESFQKNGFRTMWSGKIFHTSGKNYISRPGRKRIDAMWDDKRGHDGGYGPWPSTNRLLKKNKWFNYEEWTGPDEDFPDVRNANITIERLKEDYDEPFFMALGFYRPHTPWTAPKRFFDMYPLEDIKVPVVPEDDLEDVPPIGRKWARVNVDLQNLKENKKWKEALRGYFASISFLDYNLGRVLKALENSPYRDNTIVVLWADHGFHMGEKKHFTKFALWEQTTHSLLMMRIPGVGEGEKREQAVNLIDLYPTLQDYCELSGISQDLDGISLRPIIEDAEYQREKPSLTFYKGGSIGMRDEKWRFIRYHDGSEELYNLKQDPLEWENLANDVQYEEVKELFYKWIPKNKLSRAGSRVEKIK